MDLLEALRHMHDDQLIRPKTWVRSGCAFGHHGMYPYPTLRPGNGVSLGLSCTIGELLGEWEVITVNAVLMER